MGGGSPPIKKLIGSIAAEIRAQTLKIKITVTTAMAQLTKVDCVAKSVGIIGACGQLLSLPLLVDFRTFFGPPPPSHLAALNIAPNPISY